MDERTRDVEFTEYADACWGSLVRSAVFLGASPHDAEDLAQTTLVKCYRAWPSIAAAENRDGYVYRTLVNTFRDSRRRRWWGERSTADLPETAPLSDESERLAIADAVHRALATLSRVNREVVVLRYFVQLSERQTAQALGVPAGTVKSRLSRALAHLAANDHVLELERN